MQVNAMPGTCGSVVLHSFWGSKQEIKAFVKEVKEQYKNRDTSFFLAVVTSLQKAAEEVLTEEGFGVSDHAANAHAIKPYTENTKTVRVWLYINKPIPKFETKEKN